MNLCSRWAPCACLRLSHPDFHPSGLETGRAQRQDDGGSRKVQCWFKRSSRQTRASQTNSRTHCNRAAGWVNRQVLSRCNAGDHFRGAGPERDD